LLPVQVFIRDINFVEGSGEPDYGKPIPILGLLRQGCFLCWKQSRCLTLIVGALD
jgi:hypothetical protein